MTGARLVTVHTHGVFIVLPHWETNQPAPWLDIARTHCILTLSEPALVLF